MTDTEKQQAKEFELLKDVAQLKDSLTRVMLDRGVSRDTVKANLDKITEIHLRSLKLGQNEK